jgi:hypothetical protein
MVSPEEVPTDRPTPSKGAKRPTAARSEADNAVVVVTLKVSDGSIQKVEAVEPGGARHDLTAAEVEALRAERSNATVAGLVHQAFEAGIACILDDMHNGAADEASDESREDAMLHDELLGALIEQSPARRLLRREVLNRALLGTIFSEASGATPAPAQ